MKLFDRNEKYIAHYKRSADGSFVISVLNNVNLTGLPAPGVKTGRTSAYTLTPEAFNKLKDDNSLITEVELKQPTLFDFMVNHS